VGGGEIHEGRQRSLAELRGATGGDSLFVKQFQGQKPRGFLGQIADIQLGRGDQFFGKFDAKRGHTLSLPQLLNLRVEFSAYTMMKSGRAAPEGQCRR